MLWDHNREQPSDILSSAYSLPAPPACCHFLTPDVPEQEEMTAGQTPGRGRPQHAKSPHCSWKQGGWCSCIRLSPAQGAPRNRAGSCRVRAPRLFGEEGVWPVRGSGWQEDMGSWRGIAAGSGRALKLRYWDSVAEGHMREGEALHQIKILDLGW